MKIIAFIPVRGGSKSIPLKNIKNLCGKPLLYWSLLALERTNDIDRIIVATDSDKIKESIQSFNFRKIIIYQRLPQNASDTATTESVMLEYLEKNELDDNDIFMLVQATSPLTESDHFTEALKIYKNGNYDSMLTCVRNRRFFWNDKGIPQNYDYQQRPRRQDFKGQLMENGAFYINTVKNIKQSKNRLCGKIGIYEMPEYMANEIDEPEDWIIIEHLMKKHVLEKLEKDEIYKPIKLYLCDVDGVLTDGGMYYSENGDEMKKFNTRDGMAFELLQTAGIKTGIITSEHTKIVENRARKMKMDFIIQGKRDGGKLAAAQAICNELGISLAETAYIGDDINCKELLENVGYAFCPVDAVKEIKEIYNIIVLSKKGGEGVVRESINKIIYRLKQQ